MKLTLFIFLPIIIAACATRHAPVARMSPYSVPGTTLPSEGIESVRYAENIKAYPLGRYVDPNNSRIMHEAHDIYRVETTAKWNLHPNAQASVQIGPVRVRDSARTTAPVGNELVAEVNAQREATKAVMQGGQVITQKLNELAGKLQQTQQVAEQNAQLKQELDTTRKRLDALEDQLRATQPARTTRQQPEQFEKPEW